MVHHRNSRWRLFALIAFFTFSAAAFFGTAVVGVIADVPSTPGTFQEVTPLSQATTDDVVFGLVEWGGDDSGYFVVELQVRNDGTLPVRLEAHLVALTVKSLDLSTDQRELVRSSPSLPCSLGPNEHFTIRFSFDLDPTETPVELSVGIAEVNRSGAKVIFPLQPGAGASAIGGSGNAGNDAGDAYSTPSPSAAPIESTGASPEAGGCQH